MIIKIIIMIITTIICSESEHQQGVAGEGVAFDGRSASSLAARSCSVYIIIIIIIISNIIIMIIIMIYIYIYIYIYTYSIHYPKYDDNVCSNLSAPGAEQLQKLLSVGPEDYMFSKNCSKSTDDP